VHHPYIRGELSGASEPGLAMNRKAIKHYGKFMRRVATSPISHKLPPNDAVYVDRDYEPDETEFMMAMDKYKCEKRRPFPTWSEVLGVLKSLGYHK
jgi:hypothetical protein